MSGKSQGLRDRRPPRLREKVIFTIWIWLATFIIQLLVWSNVPPGAFSVAFILLTSAASLCALIWLWLFVPSSGQFETGLVRFLKRIVWPFQ